MPDTPAGPETSPPSRTDPDSFNHRVYRIVRRIPRGMVTTYGTIAQALGDPRKAREVGWALNAKPKSESAPAHRVINREGRLSGGWAFGSPEVQRGLLVEDGVTFLPDGRVDLEQYLWQPEECDDAPQPREPSLFDLLEEERE
jgi:methylated-DNA-protein-cysteine methyltransferase related protein